MKRSFKLELKAKMEDILKPLKEYPFKNKKWTFNRHEGYNWRFIVDKVEFYFTLNIVDEYCSYDIKEVRKNDLTGELLKYYLKNYIALKDVLCNHSTVHKDLPELIRVSNKVIEDVISLRDEYEEKYCQYLDDKNETIYSCGFYDEFHNILDLVTKKYLQAKNNVKHEYAK